MVAKRKRGKPVLSNGGGWFDDIFGGGGGGGDNVYEYIITVKSTRQMDVKSFDTRFKSSGYYELTNIIDVGSALRIYCMDRTDNEIRYSILAYEKRFGAVYHKIRTGYWLKFSLEVFTAKGKLKDYDVLTDVLVYDGKPTWESFVSEDDWEGAWWSGRDAMMAFGDLAHFPKYIGYAIQDNTGDQITQALIKDRKYFKALARICRI